MYIKLNEIAVITSGYAFREAIEPDNSGNLYVFQAKDLTEGVPFEDVDSLPRVSRNLSEYSGYLRKNDVIIVARGMKAGSFRTTIFASERLNVIASSSVHIIRITRSNVIPEYVSYYLNSKEGQKRLSQIVSGSYIGVISRKKLERTDIPLPSVEKQQLLVKLFKNMIEQQEIFERKNLLKREIIEETFRKITI